MLMYQNGNTCLYDQTLRMNKGIDWRGSCVKTKTGLVHSILCLPPSQLSLSDA
jgi:hypothetical protein